MGDIYWEGMIVYLMIDTIFYKYNAFWLKRFFIVF